MNIKAILSLPEATKDTLLAALLANTEAKPPKVKIGGKVAAKRVAKAVKAATAKPAKAKAAPAVKAAPKPGIAKAKGRKPVAATFPGLLGDVAATDGSVNAIARALGVSKQTATAALKAAVKAGTVFVAGKTRAMRYGISPEQAKARSQAAHGPQNGVAQAAVN